MCCGDLKNVQINESITGYERTISPVINLKQLYKCLYNSQELELYTVHPVRLCDLNTAPKWYNLTHDVERFQSSE